MASIVHSTDAGHAYEPPEWHQVLQRQSTRIGIKDEPPNRWPDGFDFAGIEDLPVANILIEASPYYQFASQTEDMSPIERRMAVGLAMVSQSLRWEAQYRIGDYIADFIVWRQGDPQRVVVECDGHDFHERTAQQAAHDKRRDRFMTRAGYKVLRFTGSEIHRDLWGCVSEVYESFDWDSDV
jgi:very-short-patch-repair endonuclease